MSFDINLNDPRPDWWWVYETLVRLGEWRRAAEVLRVAEMRRRLRQESEGTAR